jgi:hypothetical protein
MATSGKKTKTGPRAPSKRLSIKKEPLRPQQQRGGKLESKSRARPVPRGRPRPWVKEK